MVPLNLNHHIAVSRLLASIILSLEMHALGEPKYFYKIIFILFAVEIDKFVGTVGLVIWLLCNR